jgi:DNA-binding SARP family transcriptional activator
MGPPSCRRLAITTVIGAVLVLAEPATAEAAQAHSFADEQTSRSYSIPVTNPLTKVNLPSILLVTSVHIDTSLPDGSGVQAPKGFLYLTLQMSSGPVQRSTGDPLSGSFYSQMTPLPASAFSYVTSSTKSYPATRINPVEQANNPAASTDDGMVDATYYFTVPSTNRTGTVIIAPTRTMGTPYVSFTGSSPVELTIEGPTKIPVHLPSQLTVVSAPTSPGSTSSKSHLIPIALLVIIGLGAAVYLTRRRRGTPTSRPTPMTATPAHSPTHIATPVTAHTTTATAPPPRASDRDDIEVQTPPKPVDNQAPQLRVKVLGALEFDPPVRGLSDPARSLLGYLAFHRDRLMSAGEIQTALWPTSKTTKDVSRNTFHNYVTEARKAVGSTVLPESARGAGYQLQNISIDFEEFETLEKTSRTADDPQSIELRVQALAMVREHPFASEVATYFEWVRAEGLEGRIVRSVSDLAYRTALDQIRLGDSKGAEVSLRIGLLVTPVSMALWEQLTDLVASRGDPSLLRLHWTQAQSLLSESDVDRLRQRLHE